MIKSNSIHKSNFIYIYREGFNPIKKQWETYLKSEGQNPEKSFSHLLTPESNSVKHQSHCMRSGI